MGRGEEGEVLSWGWVGREGKKNEIGMERNRQIQYYGREREGKRERDGGKVGKDKRG